MRIFSCDGCGQTLNFENVVCVRCGLALGFLPDRLELRSLAVDGAGDWHLLGSTARTQAGGVRYRQCANYSDNGVCNWMAPASQASSLCIACDLNDTIPDLSIAENLTRWHRLENAKRRLVYSLLRFGLPVTSRRHDPATGLAFAFLADAPAGSSEGGTVTTGHSDGLITINSAEADRVQREQARKDMDEVYRTLLGHFRHESGHFYWYRLVAEGGWLDPVRALFGDERSDYAAALARHYEQGPPPDWQSNYVSAYASSHPWEDWAESWAHYLHIVDTLETAWQFGLRISARIDDSGALQARATFDPYACTDFEPLVEHWLPLVYAVNNINRSMGLDDLYPFVLPDAAIAKLALVHRIVRAAANANLAQAPSA